MSDLAADAVCLLDAFPDAKLLVLEDIGHGVLPERH